MPKQIPLTKGYSTIVDDADYDWLNSFKWYVGVSGGGTTRYAIRSLPAADTQTRRTTGSMHRLILPGVGTVDHRDGDGLNNQRSNLRAATRSGNSQNRRKARNNTSGFVGVIWNRRDGIWHAQIRVRHQFIYLGRFADPVEAAMTRDAAALEMHGEFAHLNFPRNPTQ
jgi:hypothetical protein